jgi:hypothetical protein
MIMLVKEQFRYLLSRSLKTKEAIYNVEWGLLTSTVFEVTSFGRNQMDENIRSSFKLEASSSPIPSPQISMWLLENV